MRLPTEVPVEVRIVPGPSHHAEPLGLLTGEGGHVDFSEGAGERLATIRPKLKAVIAESHDAGCTQAQREQARTHSFTLRQKMLRLERAEAVALIAGVMNLERWAKGTAWLLPSYRGLMCSKCPRIQVLTPDDVLKERRFTEHDVCGEEPHGRWIPIEVHLRGVHA